MNKKARNLFSWMNPKLKVRRSSKYGKGVFAINNIKKNEILIVMGGYILTIEDDNKMRGYIADKAIEISDYFFIGPRNISDLKLMPQHYVNHSCNPNVGFKGHIFMVAMKNIKCGHEIFYDYAMVMQPDTRSNSYFKMKCECGSRNCRKHITEDDWELPYLQLKYNGFFNYFLQEKINNRSTKKLRKNNKSKLAPYQLKQAPWDKK